MTLGDIIAEYRRDHGLSMDKFAALSGISKGYISMLEKNRTQRGDEPSPSIETYRCVARAIGVDADALIRMVDGKITLSDAIDPLTIPGIIPMPETRKIPLLGTIACGTPILAAENLDGEVDIPKSIHADFALICRGDSMIGARIHDGDVVYIRQQPTVENGQIAAVLIDDEATLKRVYIYPDQLVLNAENPIYTPMIYAGDNRDTIRIIGKAVGFTSKRV